MTKQITRLFVHAKMSQRLQRLHQLLETSPNDSFALFALAKEYEGLQDAEQALAYYLRLRALDPGYVGLYYHLGKLLEKTGQPDSALQTYRQGMEVAKQAGDMHAYSELNVARMDLDDSDEDE